MTNKQAAFWDRMAEKYFRSPVKNQSAYETKLDRIGKFLQSSSTVLELGCGTGSTALTLADKVAQYDAYDFSQGMIAIANRRATELNIKNISFAVKDIAADPKAENSYDIVMAHSLLHLVDNSDAVIGSMIDALKPNGYAVFSLVLLKPLALPMRWLLTLGSKTGLIPSLVYQDKSDMLNPILAGKLKLIDSWQVDKNNLFVIAQKAS